MDAFVTFSCIILYILYIPLQSLLKKRMRKQARPTGEEALSGLDQRERKRHPSDGAMVFVKGNWLFCSAMVRCFYGAKEISKQAGKQARSTYYYIKVRERGFKRFCSYNCDGLSEGKDHFWQYKCDG
nr:hypothetical protein Q903MT_gene1376 [Picea sitchensis]